MFRLFAIFACVVTVVAACGDDDEPVAAGDGDRSTPGAVFEPSGEYLSDGVTDAGEPRPLVDGTRISLDLRDGQLSARAGCNSMSGPYSLDAGVLRAPELATTEMGCVAPLTEQDRWLSQLLLSEPTMKRTDDGFLLTSGSTEIRFVDRSTADPDAELVGTVWDVTGFVDGDVAMSSSAGDRPARLQFLDTGFVVGHDGCNELGTAPDAGVRYRVEGVEITFEGEPVTTDVACPGLEEAVERFHVVLEGTVTHDISAANLTITARDGRGVTYTARP